MYLVFELLDKDLKQYMDHCKTNRISIAKDLVKVRLYERDCLESDEQILISSAAVLVPNASRRRVLPCTPSNSPGS